MKKPLLLFAVKCSVIVYLTAFTNIEDFTVSKSVTPILSKGIWKVNLCADAKFDQTSDFGGYNFSFTRSGVLKASKEGVVVKGNWSENNTSNRITINLVTSDPALVKLNDNWHISTISKGKVSLERVDKPLAEKINIASL